MGTHVLDITHTGRKYLLTNQQAVQPLSKRNRAHKQYSARFTRWLDQLSRFDVKIQYTAGKNIPPMDYLSRHPIIHDNERETQCEQDEKEAEDEFVINQIYGLFEFNRTSASTTRYFEEPPSGQDLDQSQRST